MSAESMSRYVDPFVSRIVALPGEGIEATKPAVAEAMGGTGITVENLQRLTRTHRASAEGNCTVHRAGKRSVERIPQSRGLLRVVQLVQSLLYRLRYSLTHSPAFG